MNIKNSCKSLQLFFKSVNFSADQLNNIDVSCILLTYAMADLGLHVNLYGDAMCGVNFSEMVKEMNNKSDER